MNPIGHPIMIEVDLLQKALKTHRRKEQRFATHENHRIAKQLVTHAQDTRRGLALEDLTGIRDRITIRRAQRRRHHSWAFHQLRHFIEAKHAWPRQPGSRRAGTGLSCLQLFCWSIELV